MEMDPILLSRVQFAFTVSFHIIFPAFTVGLAAWLATLQGIYVFTGLESYRKLFDFWLKIFAVAFGMGVVSGIVMAFQFGTNWSVLSARSGPVMGPLLSYEAFSAFLLEATFLGVLLFGRDKLPPWLYFVCAVCVALGTTVSSYWILVNNSWMHFPVGYAEQNGFYVPTDWWPILTSEAVISRFPHMLLAAYITTCFCVLATGAWYLLRDRSVREAKIMILMGIGFGALVVPMQIFFGHEAGLFIREHQPEKYAAFEGRWETEQPARFIVFAIPDVENEENDFEIAIPILGSLINGDPNGEEIGIKAYPLENRPPIWLPFFTFRIMVAMGLIMLAVAWGGLLLLMMGRLFTSRWYLWAAFLSFPTGFIAILTGWFASEIGRQPWTIQYLLRTADSHSPIGAVEVMISLTSFLLVYTLIFASGVFYIYRLLREGLDSDTGAVPMGATSKRPLAVPGDRPVEPATGSNHATE